MASFNPVTRSLAAPLCLEMCDRQGRRKKFERGRQREEVRRMGQPVRGLGSRHHRAYVKILRELGMPKRLYGEPGGTQLPQAPPVATPLVIGTGLSIEFWTGVFTSLYFFTLRHFTTSRAVPWPEGELLGSWRCSPAAA